MKIRKDNIEEILKLDIEDIDVDKLYPIYKSWRKDDYPDFLDAIVDYLGDNLFSDDGDYYSHDSDRVEFVRSKIVEWFGKLYGIALIDEQYWLLSYAFTDDGISFWNIEKIDISNLEKAKKLVKLLSISEEIGNNLKC